MQVHLKLETTLKKCEDARNERPPGCGYTALSKVIIPLKFGGRHVGDRLEPPPVVELVQPRERGVLDGADAARRTAARSA
jgi:hypothetical protein